MERFIPTDIFRKKSNTFQGITFFSVSPLRPEFFESFVRVARTRPQRESAKHRSLVKTLRVLQTATEMLFTEVYTCGQTCCFSFTLLADFLAHNCEITGKSDGCF